MEQGLTTDEVIAKQKKYGKNLIISSSRLSPLKLFLRQFWTLLNAILFLAALISFMVSDFIDGIFILAIIFLNSAIGFSQEYKAEKSLEKLKQYTTPIVHVIRNHKEAEVLSLEIVPGDLVVLREGDRIPADGIVLSSRHMESDESLLTGEASPVLKAKKDQLFMGMLITKGNGHMLVERTGQETRFGQIASSLSSIREDRAPLQIQVDNLGKLITLFVIVLSLLLLPFGLFYGREVMPLLLVIVSICVAAIPESLPVIITIALAIGTTRMARRRAIVRKMPAVETLGAVSYLLVDKTGTLTQNTMRVKEYWLYQKNSLAQLFKACLLGNTASLSKNNSKTKYDVIGDSTDGALLLFAQDEKAIREVAGGKIIDEYVFDNKYQTITTLWQKQDKIFSYVRGAPEKILKQCLLSLEEKQAIQAIINDYSNLGYRVIAFAHKTIGDKQQLTRNEAEKELNFIGLVGIYDPPRPEVKKALNLANMAGIKTIMVTGDSPPTALSIAKEIGLIESNEDVISGEMLNDLSDEELKELLPRTRIFARSKPEDKLRLVNLLKEMGQVVGVTGDGVNDSLALKRADVGVAMGKSGTDVAKEASDIVISDDNFATLIEAIIQGRSIYRNIKTALIYLLASNFSELFFVFLAGILNLPLPLYTTQILWINLVTDGLPAIALATAGTLRNTIYDLPRNPATPILNNKAIVKILLIAGVLCALFLFCYISVAQQASLHIARLSVFNLIIASHLGLAYFIRGKSSFTKSKLLLLLIILTIIIQILITFNPFLRIIFHL